MNKTTIKPSISKILLFWVIMSVTITLIVIAFNWNEFSDLSSFLVVVLVAPIQCLIFCIIFFNLPYFRVEINDASLAGPSGFGFAWQRIQIPFEDVDLRNIDTGLQWLGFYMIRSKTGGKLSLWGFDEEQFEKLVAVVNNKRASAR